MIKNDTVDGLGLLNSVQTQNCIQSVETWLLIFQLLRIKWALLIEWFLFCLVFLDEDRLSRRKSIVDTVSIQVDILPGNNTEDKVW